MLEWRKNAKIAALRHQIHLFYIYTARQTPYKATNYNHNTFLYAKNCMFKIK